MIFSHRKRGVGVYRNSEGAAKTREKGGLRAVEDESEDEGSRGSDVDSESESEGCLRLTLSVGVKSKREKRYSKGWKDK